jgi:hypothetical protein
MQGASACERRRGVSGAADLRRCRGWGCHRLRVVQGMGRRRWPRVEQTMGRHGGRGWTRRWGGALIVTVVFSDSDTESSYHRGWSRRWGGSCGHARVAHQRGEGGSSRGRGGNGANGLGGGGSCGGANRGARRGGGGGCGGAGGDGQGPSPLGRGHGRGEARP